MTKSQIKAELRRSACEDDLPVAQLSSFAWRYLVDHNYRNFGSGLESMDDWRTFFLLVAEAL